MWIELESTLKGLNIIFFQNLTIDSLPKKEAQTRTKSGGIYFGNGFLNSKFLQFKQKNSAFRTHM